MRDFDFSKFMTYMVGARGQKTLKIEPFKNGSWYTLICTHVWRTWQSLLVKKNKKNIQTWCSLPSERICHVILDYINDQSCIVKNLFGFYAKQSCENCTNPIFSPILSIAYTEVPTKSAQIRKQTNKKEMLSPCRKKPKQTKRFKPKSFTVSVESEWDRFPVLESIQSVLSLKYNCFSYYCSWKMKTFRLRFSGV